MTWWQQLIMQLALSGLQILNARSENSNNQKTATSGAVAAAQIKIAQMEFKGTSKDAKID